MPKAMTAMITPMKDNGEVDYKGLEKQFEYQLMWGIKGLVALGTTGETPTLTSAEQKKIIKLFAKEFKYYSGTTLVVGTGTNDTKTTIEKTKLARDLGADAALVVTPYYNKPNKSGLIKHFYSAADIMPVIVYDIKGRTGRQIEPDEFDEIFRHPNIIGVKAASGDLEQIETLIPIAMLAEVAAGRKIHIWSGDDSMTLPVRDEGGHGVISVVSNLMPEQVALLATSNDQKILDKLSEKMAPVIKAAFTECNPVAIKHMMHHAKLINSNTVRLPLGQLSPENKKFVENITDRYLQKTR
jgi:4-hydroxy-tetrahydrodipicolinate synthase